MSEQYRQKSLGLSFSGGGVHAWAEAAVYQELERQNIEVHAVTGTSMGSFLAAAVASGLSSEEIYEVIKETDEAIHASRLFHHRALLNLFSFRRPMGLVLMEKLAEVIKPVSRLYNEVMLSDVPKPLAIPAVDIVSRQLIVFSNQPEYFKQTFKNAKFYEKDIPLVKACLASSAFPIVLSPVKVDDYQLVDGGVMMNSPASLFSEEYIEHVFAVRIKSEHFFEPITRRMEVGIEAIEMMVGAQEEFTTNTEAEEYMIKLKLPGSFEFGGSHTIIEAGELFVKENPIDTSSMFIKEEKKRKIEDNVAITIQKPTTMKDQVSNLW